MGDDFGRPGLGRPIAPEIIGPQAQVNVRTWPITRAEVPMPEATVDVQPVVARVDRTVPQPGASVDVGPVVGRADPTVPKPSAAVTVDVTTPATATIIDDFEDGDIAEYTGDTGQFTVQGTTVFEGANALEGTSDGARHRIISTAGLNAYPAQGDTFQCRIRDDTGSLTAGIAWGVQDGNNLYRAMVSSQGDNLQLWLKENGGYNRLVETAVTVPQDEWLRLEIDWAGDGTMTVTLFDSADTQLAQISATDTTFTSGGIGWIINTGGSGQAAQYDLAEIP